MIDFRADLNTEQYEVVTKSDGPCLVLAGAGSGKTRTITYRVAYLLENGVPEDRILLVTFTNRAAREMLSRVEALLGRQAPRLWGGTFHHIALRILRQYASQIGHSPNFTILDSDDSQSMIGLTAREEGVEFKGKRVPSLRIIQDTISYSRNAGRTVADVLDLKYPRFVSHADEMETVARRYENKKREANVLDFDDLLVKLAGLLRTQADVRERLAEQFQYVLVDEYQDTNTVQAEIVYHLASRHKNLLVVGDDAQSIYSFRAANIENILGFEKQFPGSRVFKLVVNYRSTPDILELANNVIKQNTKQYEKNLKSMLPRLQKPCLISASDNFEEASQIAGRVVKLLRQGTPAREISVLFRATFHSQMLELELMKRDIPYDYRGGLRFFDRAHIKHILAFLRIYDNVRDVVAWTRILKLQAGVGDKTAQDILGALMSVEKFRDVAVLDLAAELGAKAREGWAMVQRIAEAMVNTGGGANVGGAAVQSGRPNELIQAVVTAYYREFIESEYTNWRERLDDINQLTRFAERSRDLSHFLADASLSESYANDRNRNQREDSDKIVLSTIHQAKGLEWDAVFVLNLTDGAFPNERALSEENGVEEERRLFYVAITRARRYLFLSYPLMTGRDAATLANVSPFLQEVDQRLFSHEQGGRPITILSDKDVRYVDEESQTQAQVSPRALRGAAGFLLSSVDDL